MKGYVFSFIASESVLGAASPFAPGSEVFAVRFYGNPFLSYFKTRAAAEALANGATLKQVRELDK